MSVDRIAIAKLVNLNDNNIEYLLYDGYNSIGQSKEKRNIDIEISNHSIDFVHCEIVVNTNQTSIYNNSFSIYQIKDYVSLHGTYIMTESGYSKLSKGEIKSINLLDKIKLGDVELLLQSYNKVYNHNVNIDFSDEKTQWNSESSDYKSSLDVPTQLINHEIEADTNTINSPSSSPLVDHSLTNNRVNTVIDQLNESKGNIEDNIDKLVDSDDDTDIDESHYNTSNEYIDSNVNNEDNIQYYDAIDVQSDGSDEIDTNVNNKSTTSEIETVTDSYIDINNKSNDNINNSTNSLNVSINHEKDDSDLNVSIHRSLDSILYSCDRSIELTKKFISSIDKKPSKLQDISSSDNINEDITKLSNDEVNNTIDSPGDNKSNSISSKVASKVDRKRVGRPKAVDSKIDIQLTAPSSDNPIRIIFTGIEKDSSLLDKLSDIEIVDDPMIATHMIVSDTLKRTPKLMIAINNGIQYVVTIKWLIDSIKQRKPIEINLNTKYNIKYIINDSEKEKLWNFSLHNTLVKPRHNDLFINYGFIIMRDVCGNNAPNKEEMIKIIESGGGIVWIDSDYEKDRYITNNPVEKSNSKKRKVNSPMSIVLPNDFYNDNIFIISNRLDDSNIQPYRNIANNKIYLPEFIFLSIMKQSIDLNSCQVVDNKTNSITKKMKTK